MAQSGKLLMDVKAMVMKLGIGLCGSAKADFANQLDFHGKDIVALKTQRFIKKPKNRFKDHQYHNRPSQDEDGDQLAHLQPELDRPDQHSVQQHLQLHLHEEQVGVLQHTIDELSQRTQELDLWCPVLQTDCFYDPSFHCCVRSYHGRNRRGKVVTMMR